MLKANKLVSFPVLVSTLNGGGTTLNMMPCVIIDKTTLCDEDKGDNDDSKSSNSNNNTNSNNNSS